MRRGLKITLITVGSLIVLIGGGLAATTISNAVVTAQESKRITDYGSRVELSSGAVNVVERGSGDTTIVLLPGFGTAAPGLDFEPLISELSSDFRVIAYEPPGSGLSDDTTVPRTAANYVKELHETLAHLQVERPVLMGHSIAGIYALEYTRQFPDEVAAFVGIDTSVPNQPGSDESLPLAELKPLQSLGLLRFLAADDPSANAGSVFTPAAREQMQLLATRNALNDAQLSEAELLPDTFAGVSDLTFPADLPVLLFVAPDAELADWLTLHQEQAAGVERGAVIELPGGHYLHHTQSPAIVSETERFLATAVPAE